MTLKFFNISKIASFSFFLQLFNSSSLQLFNSSSLPLFLSSTLQLFNSPFKMPLKRVAVVVHNDNNDILVQLSNKKYKFPCGNHLASAFLSLEVELEAVYLKTHCTGNLQWVFAKSRTLFPESAKWVHMTDLFDLDLVKSAKKIVPIIISSLSSPSALSSSLPSSSPSSFGECYATHFAVPSPLLPPPLHDSSSLSLPTLPPLPTLPSPFSPPSLPSLPPFSNLPSISFDDLFPSPVTRVRAFQTLEIPQQMIVSPLIPFPF